MSIEGIDVYSGDHEVNWALVAESGRRFAFAKATEGSTYSDSSFPDNWRGMKAAGILRGAYHFARPQLGSDGTVESSALLQATHFFQVVGGTAPGDLPPTLDLEQGAANLTPAQVLAWTRAFVRRIEALFGRAPILYVGHYWREALGNPVVPDLARCPLWTPRYGVEPILPRAWSRWTFWQYTDGKVGPNPGRIPGLVAPCDKDLFNGTLDELRALAGLPPLGPPAPPWPGRNFAWPSDPPYHGDDVWQWQERMAALGWEIDADGWYGPQSRRVCAAFQRETALTVDGIVGPKTWAASFAVLAPSCPVDPVG